MVGGGSRPSIGASAPGVSFGSSDKNDVVIKKKMVSGRHAIIAWDGAELVLEDLGSTNGTKLNGVKVTRIAQVSLGDEVSFGSHSFELTPSFLEKFVEMELPIPGLIGEIQRRREQRAFRKTQIEQLPRVKLVPGPVIGARKSTTIPLGAVSIGIGYADENDLVLKVPQISRQHCRLWRWESTLILEDLGSSNGTFVAGERVQSAIVSKGDVVGLGSYRLTLDDVVVGMIGTAVAAAETSLERRGAAKKIIRIGRDPSAGVNDIVLDEPQVSKEHCELSFLGHGWHVRDLGSTNGTFIGSTRHQVTEAVATTSDVLFFGSYRFPLSRLDARVGGPTLPSASGRKAVIVIGRDTNCDITIAEPQVSRRHARLTRSAERWFVEDLGSANGTFVNGDRVTKSTAVTEDDWIQLGSHRVKFDLGAGELARTYIGDIMLQADNVTVKVDSGRKTILHNVSFTVYPTEFVGLMGPSGAGKTTLIMALNGYLPPQGGRSLINNLDLYSHYNAFRGHIGYVPQDDIIHAELTVYEALYYTAKLRCPPDTLREEIEEMIDRILSQLEIEEARHVVIGSPEKKGISGGQRKRVNLALELLTQPSLLFLDEPTSGLASEDALNVMKLLRRLADEGRTILLTIHQPSLEAYRTMDNVLYLSDGHLVYYGPVYPDSITFFNPSADSGSPEGDRLLADPSSAMEPIARDRRNGVDMRSRSERYKRSAYHSEYVQKRRREPGGADIDGGGKQKARRRMGLRQWQVLTRRYFNIKLKDVANMAILLLQAPIIAIIIVLVFQGELQGSFGRTTYEPMALFLLVISSIWFGCSNAAREIVSERAIYWRERMVNLKIVSYVMSKFAVLGFFCAVQCVMLLSITHIGLGFYGDFFEIFGILLLSSLSGVGMGLVLSAMVKTSEAAISLVPMLLIPQVILAGLVIPVGNLPPSMNQLSKTMMSRWGFEALLHVEDRGRAFEITEGDIQKEEVSLRRKLLEDEAFASGGTDALLDGRASISVQPPEHPLDRYFHANSVGTNIDLGVLALFNLMMLLSVVAIMKVNDPEVY